MEDRDIVYTGCPNCGSYFEVTPEVLGTSEVLSKENLAFDCEKEIKWWFESKKCWACGGEYLPVKRYTKTFDFVFDAFKRTKGEKHGI